MNKKQLQQRRQTVVGLLETSLNSGGGNNDGSGSNNCFGGNETVMQPVLGTLCPGPNPWDPASRLPNSNPYIAQEQPYMQMLAAHAKRRANREVKFINEKKSHIISCTVANLLVFILIFLFSGTSRS